MSELSDANKKAQRLFRISFYLYRNPHGLTVAELAKMCGVSKRTIQRDLNDFEDLHIPITNDGGNPPRWTIISGYYIPPVHFSFDEALALYLAARLLARYADEFDPHIADALAKLAGVLPEALARHIHSTIRSLTTRENDERLVRVLGVLATGWATGRVVRIVHRAAASEEAHPTLIRPYFIEPSAAGNATYVIGKVHYSEELHTFKVERILDATLMNEHFEIPEDFDGPALLAHAWSIWYGETREEGMLRFSPEVTRRVKETHWHPSQQLADTEDGGCILRMWVADPHEMIYWVRGWGPGVEVLTPAWLRDQIAREADQVRAKYGRAELTASATS